MVADRNSIRLVEAAGDGAVLYYDDIQWSRSMMAAWDEIRSWPRDISAAIDIGRAGICVVRRGASGPPAQYRADSA
jgi:hypothetical protein